MWIKGSDPIDCRYWVGASLSRTNSYMRDVEEAKRIRRDGNNNWARRSEQPDKVIQEMNYEKNSLERAVYK